MLKIWDLTIWEKGLLTGEKESAMLIWMEGREHNSFKTSTHTIFFVCCADCRERERENALFRRRKRGG